jgi:hypothetical protein
LSERKGAETLVLRGHFAPLKPGQPEDGYGLYEDGICKYYSAGGRWFFEMGTGRMAFYTTEDGTLYTPDGQVVSRAGLDTSPLKAIDQKGAQASLVSYVMMQERNRT